MDLARIRESFVWLRDHTRGVRHVLLVTDDGFPVVSTLASGDREQRSTAAAARMSEAGRRALLDLDMGGLDVIVTMGSEGCLVQKRLGPDATVLILCDPTAQLGLVLGRLRRILPALEEAGRV